MTNQIQPSAAQARALSERTSTMLPRITASEERDERRNRALAWRRSGLALSAAEMITDLRDTLDTLLSRLALYRAGKSTFIKTPDQMLAYVEHVASFITRDYARELEGNASVTALWDAFDRMHTGPHAWRNGEYPYSAAPAIIESVHRMAQEARAKAGIHRPEIAAAPAIVIDMNKTFDKPIRRRLPGFD